MFEATARDTVQRLVASPIREVANAGMGLPDILPFWFGESDQATPRFISDAAEEALRQGKTFYTHNLGLPALRQAISAYLGRLHGRPFALDRIAVTGSGVSALMLAAQTIVEPGDRVVAVTPIWPNLVEIPRILGGQVTRVPLQVSNGRWQLDLDRLIDALTPNTRLLLLNSPNNPTGWTIERAEQQAVMEHCRRHGIWVVADDVYERLVFAEGLASAPSFLTLAEPEERVIGVNSFSKAWNMTGWRLGWLVVPPALTADLGKLIEYNTSCAPEFVQAGGVAAIEQGEAHVAAQRASLAAARKQIYAALDALPGVELPTADGAMYAFFRLEGRTDSMALAKALVREAGLGLAPGIAFGREAEGWLRWCFAAEPAKLSEGIQRIGRFLGR